MPENDASQVILEVSLVHCYDTFFAKTFIRKILSPCGKQNGDLFSQLSTLIYNSMVVHCSIRD